MAVRDPVRMKGLSIIFTALLLVFAHHLAARMRHSGILPAAQVAKPTPSFHTGMSHSSGPASVVRL
jgi:hypothetical protein